jgi:predicted AAA+ superfamily ATPase
MILRSQARSRLDAALRRSPVTALLGPRQSGKTTLARQIQAEQGAVFFDLESQPDRRRLQNPELVLSAMQGLVILDEIQAMPELFATLRVLVDRPETRLRFLVLGSASPQLVRGASESLAGRVEFVELTGFDIAEVGASAWRELWLRGGFPRSFLADSDADSLVWRENFIRTFLERDIPQFGIGVAPAAMRRFWTMLAHGHGQTFNASELGRAMSLADKTVRVYLDILSDTFMVRQLQPWFQNIGKRQVKSPKIYLRDSGILHALINLEREATLLSHPRVGASWEGFALEQVLAALRPADAYFWATHAGAELDLLFFQGGRRFGIEFKFSEAPRPSRSMHIALDDLDLAHLWIVAPVHEPFVVHERMTVWPLQAVEGLRREVRGRVR